MSSNDGRPPRRSGRPRRLPERIAVEGLETRQLMAYSSFGYSLPELSVTGYAAPRAAWGGPLSIEVTVQNQGASSLVEPLDLAPGSTSTADAPPTTVEVYGSSRAGSTRNLVDLGTIQIPSVTQNSSYMTDATIVLPAKPQGYKAASGNLYLTLVVNNDQGIVQETNAQNVYHVPAPVKLAAPLPDLQVVGFDIPTPLYPGEVIAPTIRIANLGAADPAVQGPVTVDLVASLTKNFGPGDAIVGTFTIDSLPGLNEVPTQAGTVASTVDNLVPGINEITTNLTPLALPASPGSYYLGIKIDPTSSIHQTYPPSPGLLDVVQVGPRNHQVPPGTLLVDTNGQIPVFPQLPSAVIGPVNAQSTTVPQYPPATGVTAPILNNSTMVTAESLPVKKKR